jgi:hypothetical protein
VSTKFRVVFKAHLNPPYRAQYRSMFIWRKLPDYNNEHETFERALACCLYQAEKWAPAAIPPAKVLWSGTKRNLDTAFDLIVELYKGSAK